MKAVMISIKPKWVAKILNGEKTIEVRRKFPKEFKGWVYIYTTREYGKALIKENCMFEIANVTSIPSHTKAIRNGKLYEPYNGKVVARFYCNKVEEIIFGTTLYNDFGFFTGNLFHFELYKQSCLTKKEMQNYLKIKPKGLSGYAIHISQLEIFDKPKKLDSYIKIRNYDNCINCSYADDKTLSSCYWCDEAELLERPFQSWGYIEVEE